MALGSAPEIGKNFVLGAKDISYPWIIDGKQHQLMHGEAKIGYIAGRPDNVYPPEDHKWEFADHGKYSKSTGYIV